METPLNPSQSRSDEKITKSSLESWIWNGLFVLVLGLAAYLRFKGLLWGEFSYLHPDERFLAWVTTDMSPVHSLAEYFNTAISTLNPHNVGHGYFVYGTFPVILTRYLVELIYGGASLPNVLIVGRILSALFDTLTVILVYLIGRRLFGQKAGVIGAAFSAAAVLQIQQAHFYTSDSFAATFSTLAVFIAIEIISNPLLDLNPLNPRRRWWQNRSLVLSLFFGVAVGFAMACKINAAVFALILLAAILVRLFQIRPEDRQQYWRITLINLIAGGVAAFLIFRIFQPYAFQGPGFFNILPNEKWINNLIELASETKGNVDFPPALQWARRPVTFSLQNMVLWGMGLAFGLTAWVSFLWMGWFLFKGEWKKTIILWGWTAIYFVWQSLLGNPTMRYQLPIYPLLAVIAGWGLVQAWQKARSLVNAREKQFWQVIVCAIAGVSLSVTLIWAFAFTRIYQQPLTRVAASDWIYANIPTGINLSISTADGISTQPLSYAPQLTLKSSEPYEFVFLAPENGIVSQIDLGNVKDLLALQGTLKTISVSVQSVENPESHCEGQITNVFAVDDTFKKVVHFEQPISIETGKQYRLVLSLPGQSSELILTGQPSLTLETLEGTQRKSLAPYSGLIRNGNPQDILFRATSSGNLEAVNLFRAVDTSGSDSEKTLLIGIYSESDPIHALASTSLTSTFKSGDDDRGSAYSLPFDQPISITKDETYRIHLSLANENGAIGIYTNALANESSWDDSLPIYRGVLDGNAGMYRTDLNFEMYWDDDEAKLSRFEDTLDSADYILISSNRQWGTTTRVEERYPLTTRYYRSLLGCPAEEDVISCYRAAEPGIYTGSLGFELVKVVESNPGIGSFVINDQFAEEAFTVYDHPKVFIFKKTDAYDSQAVAKILESVDLSTVVHVIPGQAESYPENLMLPDDRLAQQQAGGTWSELFDTTALQNRYPGVGLILWYLVVTLLGWMCYPLMRTALSGLPDRGFPLVKICAMLILAWMVWFVSSNGLTFSRLTISIAAGILLIVNLVLAYKQAPLLKREWQLRKRYFLLVEGIGLAFFLVFLIIRLGNPDLWHAAFGGEKPMDFAYFNAVLKSTTFPAYNPWLSGATINYYYFGFVLVGVLTKWLGIVPSIAYNLILPTMASLLALGAFSVGWNISQAFKAKAIEDEPNSSRLNGNSTSIFSGLASAISVVLLGNLGTIRMIWQGMMRLAAPDGVINGATLLERISWTFQGLVQLINGARLPFSTGDWYWIPSRAVPGGEAITEFPMFTFLYADPHAHLFALGLTVLALSWAVSVVLGKWQWSKDGLHPFWHVGLSIFIGALAIFALKPTNTWDFPTYLGLAIAAIFYSAMRYARVPKIVLKWLPEWAGRVLVAIIFSGAVFVLGSLLFKPYTDWYALGYSKIELWKGDRSDMASYLTHWGLFLMVIISWLTSVTIDWMAKTPLSALNKLKGSRSILYFALGTYLAAVVILAVSKVAVGWFVLTLLAWVLVLILRRNQPDSYRIILFMIGTALALTLAVEIVVLVGDIGRMNTVFKFYLQAWVLLAISSGVCFMWLLPDALYKWQPDKRKVWVGTVSVLAACALLYPLLAGSAKMRDRMSESAPHSLDGMAFMRTSTYVENEQVMDLDQDYQAIRWMQENVVGSPVIVEAQIGLYRWGARFSIYTGLPTVLGWNWHETQQRSVVGDDQVVVRAGAITEFYNSTDRATAEAFLLKYNAHYIIVGQLERITYSADGITKFDTLNGDLWNEVYRDRDTVIYEVNS